MPSAFRNLSAAHRSDYLRAYLMHHHGGGGGLINSESRGDHWNNVIVPSPLALICFLPAKVDTSPDFLPGRVRDGGCCDWRLRCYGHES